MPNVSLPTGKVMYISTYDFYFKLEDKDLDEFFQSCMADDLGIFLEDPFSQKMAHGRLDVEEVPEDILVDLYE